MSCPTCQPIACCPGGNLFFYTLSGGVSIQNNEVGFVFQCPPGFNCLPGEYPKTIVIPKGTVKMNVPVPGSGPLSVGSTSGNPPPLFLACPGGNITVSIPPGSTPQQIIALAEQMILTCAQQQAALRARPPTQRQGKVYNNPQTITVCTLPNTLSGTILGPYTFTDTTITIIGGALSSTYNPAVPGSQAAAQEFVDTLALDQLENDVADGFSGGALSCAAGFNFNNLVWHDPPLINNTADGGTNSFSNVGANASIDSVSSIGTDASFENEGNLTYDSVDPIACNLKITVNSISQGGASSSNGHIFIQDSIDGFVVSQAIVILGLGITNIPFTLPAGSGVLVSVFFTATSIGVSGTANIGFSLQLTPAS